ncbi:hypothetical protein LOC54_08205 [Acetobacter sp. AN02]|uniref:hypothetical protein n=1 Tax=Acetobacter sp. AN02 TaxID=2894186 RepID=UPI0024341BD9|nr:hypothetical protein [Acetobacter sp. AN02]MDG6095092.1 hypothetical protein [Acetobacter sp. AN02]
MPDLSPVRPSPRRAAHILAGTLVKGAMLSGLLGMTCCDLVDQRTFNPKASRPPVPYIPPAKPGRPATPPLIEVEAGTPQEEWENTLRTLTKRALARKPDVLFTVQITAPSGADATEDARTLSRITASDGQPVAATIISAGANPAQVEMAAMPVPGLAKPVIRVYIR